MPLYWSKNRSRQNWHYYNQVEGEISPKSELRPEFSEKILRNFRLVKEGLTYQVMHGGKISERYVFLYNDLLLFTKVTKIISTSYVYRGHVDIGTCYLADIPNEGEKFLRKLPEISQKVTRNFVERYQIYRRKLPEISGKIESENNTLWFEENCTKSYFFNHFCSGTKAVAMRLCRTEQIFFRSAAK